MIVLLGYGLYLTMMYFLYRLTYLCVIIYFITLFIISWLHRRTHSIIVRYVLVISLAYAAAMASRLGRSWIGSNHIFIILNTVLICCLLLLLLSLLHLLSSRDGTWRSQFTLVLWSTSRSSISNGLFLRRTIWNLSWACIERLVHTIHCTTHSGILSWLSSRLLLTLCSISSIWPNMTAATRSIHYLHRAISKWGKNRFRINICLSLGFLHLSRLWSSMIHIRQTIWIAYNHAVIIT